MTLKFRHSLRIKLILLLTSVAAISVLASCASLSLFQWHHWSTALYQDSKTQARLLAGNSGAALLFGDAKAANETLSSLRGDSRIRLACLYDKTGLIVGSYHPGSMTLGCPQISEAQTEFHFRSFKMREPVNAGSEVVGTLFLDISRAELERLLLQFFKVAAFTTLGSVCLALLLSAVTERWISRPILQLTDVAVRISEEGTYSLRATSLSQDEVGLLIHHFNEMLTQIQNRDADLRAAYDLMEQRVEERTLDLSQEIEERKIVQRDLETAKIAAEQSNQAKSRFLANMSHELRTPLNAIIGYSEMLSEDAVAAGNREAEDDLDKVLSSARHLRSVISDVLDLSKIEAGHMTVSLEATLANAMLSDVLATAEVLSKKNGNRLIVKPLEIDVEVQLDPLRFRQSLLNLVSNACKFTMNGEVTLTIRCTGGHVVWSVTDTGPGISAMNQGKLFKNFSQVDSSATRKFGGTGLGLSISQEFCKAMGGYIDVQSIVGIGSTFSLHVPLDATSSSQKVIQDALCVL